jgi:uncharacterized protein (DUF2252 family)
VFEQRIALASSGGLERKPQPRKHVKKSNDIEIKSEQKKNASSAKSETSPLGPSVKQRMALGRALREKTPRTSHAKWKPALNRPDPIELLKESDRGRLPELLPIRYARMRCSPFGFFRGAAALMAFDLARTPMTGIRVQGCGDCHVLNFGGFGSPERRLVFDINDFDETLPAPWEWDLKRLATSIVLAGGDRDESSRQCADSARQMVASYRRHMRAYAHMRAIDAWYSHIDPEIFVYQAKTARDKKHWEQIEQQARLQTAEHIFPRITDVEKGHIRIIDKPPLMYHPPNYGKASKHVRDMFHRYRLTLPDERRVILDRYKIVDVARKVVGVGSVGTRCAVVLMMAGKNDPLFLQFKEAHNSVLQPYAAKSRYLNQGERVVTGQRMLQSASDVFLGWTRDDQGHDYYFRQLRDMKMSVPLERMTKTSWQEYVEVCGWVLARAHARTGDAAQIGGYAGKKDTFDRAIAKFAIAYAEQTERDHEALVKAIKSGRLRASNGPAV